LIFDFRFSIFDLSLAGAIVVLGGVLVAGGVGGCSSADKGEAEVLVADSVGQDQGGEEVGGDAALEVEADSAEVRVPRKGCVGDFCAADEAHAPDPSVSGPFPVGVTTFTTDLYDYEDVPRTIVVDVWYPAVEEARDGPFESIDLKGRATPEALAKMPDIEIPPIPTNQVRDAAVRIADGPYPLVIFSHGAFGVRFQSVFFTQYLASHGYVVASPDHTGNTLYDMIAAEGYSMDPVVVSAFNRPLDIEHVIDEMIKRNKVPGGFFGGSMDTEQLAVTGHSFGGYTSFLMGFDDDRVKVVVPMAPATQQLVALGYELEKFPVPAMIMAGALDKTLDVQKDMRDAYAKMPAPKYYFELKAGGHYTFSDICRLDLLKLTNEMGFDDADDALRDGCGEDNIPFEAGHTIIRQFAIGFLNYHLRNSPESKKFFSPEGAELWKEDLVFEAEEL